VAREDDVGGMHIVVALSPEGVETMRRQEAAQEGEQR
jgi:hypothetical protein